MPKKKKTENLEEPREGRPDGLTLGDFLFQQIPGRQGSSATASITLTSSCEEKESEEDEIGEKYFVRRTKKGSFPLRVEKRSSGKKVTIVDNLVGNSKALLQDMKNKFGTGGIIKEDSLELQGDCLHKVSKYFNENKEIIVSYDFKLS